MKFEFNKRYFLAFVMLLIVEILIAIYLKSGFIRHTFGDFLAVILLYTFFKSFILGKSFQVALAVFIISYAIEFAQFFNILKLIKLENSQLVSTVLGSTFHISDLIAYTLGIIVILLFEHVHRISE